MHLPQKQILAGRGWNLRSSRSQPCSGWEPVGSHQVEGLLREDIEPPLGQPVLSDGKPSNYFGNMFECRYAENLTLNLLASHATIWETCHVWMQAYKLQTKTWICWQTIQLFGKHVWMQARLLQTKTEICGTPINYLGNMFECRHTFWKLKQKFVGKPFNYSGNMLECRHPSCKLKPKPVVGSWLVSVFRKIA